MTPPRKISAQFEIVTPMFLGDANKQATRISEASIKGALVFWWRALNYAGFVRRAGGDQAEALDALHQREVFLFGGGSSGQSRVLLKVIPGPNQSDVMEKGEILAKDGNSFSDPRRNGTRVVGVGARYLGYGVMAAFYSKENRNKTPPKLKEEAGELYRSCFKAGRPFSVQLVFSKKLSRNDITEVVTAIKVLGLLGGLGARVRRGWGSIVLKSLVGLDGDPWTAPKTMTEYKAELLEVIGDQARSVPGEDFSLTAFAKETDIRIGTRKNANGLEVLNDLGEGFVKYRARGRPAGTFGDVSVDGSFVKDHDWFRNVGDFSKGRRAYIPARTAFGLPHNYDSKRFGVTANDQNDRRASPLMFHIHKVDGECFAVATFLPTKFLAESKVSVWEKKVDRKKAHPYTFSKQVIEDFLNGIEHSDNGHGKKVNSPYFPNTRVFA